MGLAVACYSPTEVELDVTTDIPCPGTETQIFIDGQSGAVATAQGCASNSRTIGTYVISAGGSRSAHVEVAVALTDAPSITGEAAGCLEPKTDEIGSHCVVSRRAFTFTPHKTGYVNVRLYQQCLGYTQCGPGTTCEPTDDGKPQCVSSDAPVTDTPCPDCSSDADKPLTDASRDSGKDVNVTIDSGKQNCTDLDGGVVRSISLSDFPNKRILHDAQTGKLVWTTSAGDVMTMPKDGSQAPTRLHTHASTTPAVDVNVRAGIGWVLSQNRLYRYDLASSTMDAAATRTLAANATGIAVAVNSSQVFVLANIGVYRFSSAAGTATLGTLLTSGTGTAITANDSMVFFAAAAIESIQPDAGPGQAPFPRKALELIALESTPVAMYRAADQVGETDNSFVAGATATYIALYGSSVPYWIDHGTAPPDSVVQGPGATVLARGLGAVTGLAVDSKCLYFASADPTAGGGTQGAIRALGH
jgi:hypothetical protein